MPALAVRIFAVLAVSVALIVGLANLDVSRAEAIRIHEYAGVLVVFVAVALGVLLGRRRTGSSAIEQRVESSLQSVDLIIAAVFGSFAVGVAVVQPKLTVAVLAWATFWTVLWLPPFMRRLGTHTEVVIRRDPGTVFSFVTDPLNAPRYESNSESVEKITDGPVRVGTQYRARVNEGAAGSLDAIEEVVDYEWARRQVMRTVGTLMSATQTLTFDEDQGATLMRHRFDSVLTYAMAVAGLEILKPFLIRDMVRQRQRAWAKLKAILESPEAA